jgi:hypothetical protein
LNSRSNSRHDYLFKSNDNSKIYLNAAYSWKEMGKVDGKCLAPVCGRHFLACEGHYPLEIDRRPMEKTKIQKMPQQIEDNSIKTAGGEIFRREEASV